MGLLNQDSIPALEHSILAAEGELKEPEELKLMVPMVPIDFVQNAD